MYRPLPYTANPIYLLFKDVALFLGLTLDIRDLSLLSIIWPVRPTQSKLDELALTRGNIWAIFLHVILIFAQLGYLSFVFVAPLCGAPAILYFGVLVGGIWSNKLFCDATLNGFGGRVRYAGGKYAADPTDLQRKFHPTVSPHERWVFVNGVAVGSHWMQSNLERIARTFRRPVLGIHNATYGIIFDVLECIVQRTFAYPTTDIRTTYAEISKLLRQPEVHKLVLIGHSQGSIEVGMVLDWLFATLPHSDIAKIEVYTFGNASNHWNCPEIEGRQRAIQVIEHYANTDDWVSRFGVLYFRGIQQPPPRPIQLRDRFVGKLFLRKASGHQFNQHYLNNMFTMDRSGRKVLDSNEFMSNVTSDENFEDGQSRSGAGFGTQKPNGVSRVDPSRLLQDESRLWAYRNGGVP